MIGIPFKIKPCPSCNKTKWTPWKDVWVELITGLPGMASEMYQHRYVEQRQIRYCEACNYSQSRVVNQQRIPIEHEWKARHMTDVENALVKLSRRNRAVF